MKKITAIVSSLILSASLLVGCGASSAPAPTTAPATTPAATVAAETAAETTEVKSFSVAIVQQLSHSSLDEIHEAISAELKARAEAAGVELTISDYNGQNDTTMLGQIGAQALDDKVDMIIPIATLAAQTMVTAAEDTGTPIVYAACSDPETAGLTGLDNVTGTSDALNTPFILDMMLAINPDIKTVEDLKGKTVSIGALGSGVYFNAVDVLGVYGIDAEKDITPVYQSFGDSAESLKDGKIDAAFIVAGAPTTAITDLATAGSVYLVSIDDEHMDTLLASSPYYARSIISADTYGTPDDVQTVAVAAVVLVRDDVSEDAVYKFISTIFENSGSIQHGKAEELSVEFGSSITAVPYHPGAAKYFAEKGIEVATK